MQKKFSHLKTAINNNRLDYEITNAIKNKINGKFVMEWLNLSEKDGQIVGQIMSKIRETQTEQLLSSTQEELKNKVFQIFNYQHADHCGGLELPT